MNCICAGFDFEPKGEIHCQECVAYNVGLNEIIEWIDNTATIYRFKELDYECSHFADQLIIEEEDWLKAKERWGGQNVSTTNTR